MTDQELKELEISVGIFQNEEVEDTDAMLDRIAQIIGVPSKSESDIVKEFFYKYFLIKPILGGIEYDTFDKNIKRSSKNLQDTFDIFLLNGKDIAIIETKYKAHENDVIKLINKKYENFKKLYSEYKDYNHHLGLASFYISDDVKNEALKNNIMVLQRKGDIIETTLP